MTRLLSLVVLVALIAVTGLLFYRVMIGFLLPLFLAAVLVVIFRPVHLWLLSRWPDRTRTSALCTTLLVILTVMLPTALISTLAVKEASDAIAGLDIPGLRQRILRLPTTLNLKLPFADSTRYIESSLASLLAGDARTARGAPPPAIEDLLDALFELEADVQEAGQADKLPHLQQAIRSLRAAQQAPPGSLSYERLLREAERHFSRFNYALAGGGFRYQVLRLANPGEEDVRQWAMTVAAAAAGWLQSVGGTAGVFVFRLVFGLLILVAAVYFFLADGPAMLRTVMRLSPLDDRYERELFEEFARISWAVVVATLLSAIVQGLLAGIGFWLTGAKLVFLLILLTTVLAMVPFVGAVAVWLPVALWMFFVEERHGPSIFLAVWGMLVVSTADNIVKPLVLHGQSNIHPLVGLLSVLGGVQALGPVGILVGPMVVAFLQTSLSILQRETSRGEPRWSVREPRAPLPSILSLRLRGLRLTYAPPRKVRARSLKEPRE